jgi:glycosyltransferase involved in cell wall biosynthesis
MLRLHGRARVSIGLSISDAISTSLLEAMLMGSFPIQSHTACADEWLRHGEGGWLVHPEDPAAVADGLRRALTDDALVDRAADLNAAVARERLDAGPIRERVVAAYKWAAGRSASQTSERSCGGERT